MTQPQGHGTGEAVRISGRPLVLPLSVRFERVTALRPQYDTHYVRERDAMRERGETCVMCGVAPATSLDHVPPVAMHVHVPGSDCCQLEPACLPCQQKQGGAIGAFKAGQKRQERQLKELEIDEHDAVPGPDDPMWDRPWMADLRDVPADATWPRYMSAPHPDAVGSYGKDLERSAAEAGVTLRWFQRLVARRLLEHRADGSLCWTVTILTIARQVGKSYLLREVARWRVQQAHLFGPGQDVINAARRFEQANSIHRPVRAWAEEQGWYVRHANGQEEVRAPDGSRWLVRAINAVYGDSAALALLDEAWDVASTIVDDGLEPIIVARESGQLMLVSTAHRNAKGLMMNRRKQALDEMHEPDDALIIEWSMPRHLDDDDRDGWRMASPHWTSRREKMIERALERARSGESLDPTEPDPLESWKAQWVNQWPAKRKIAVPGIPLLQHGDWGLSIRTDQRPVESMVAAIEDYFGAGSCMALAGVSADGLVSVTGRLYDTRADAFSAAQMMDDRLDMLIVGGTLLTDPAIKSLACPVVPHGSVQTRAALSKLREMVREGRIAHDGNPDLADQVLDLRVREHNAGGLTIVSKSRSDLARCAAWAVVAVEERRALVPGVG